MKLNRQIVKDFRAILDDILNDNESLEQFIVKVGNASFDDTEVTFKVNLRLKGAESREQRDLRTFAEMDNVDVSKIAEVRGEKYSLIGYRTKARSRPYIVQNLINNKEYIFTTHMAQKYFGLEK